MLNFHNHRKYQIVLNPDVTFPMDGFRVTKCIHIRTMMLFLLFLRPFIAQDEDAILGCHIRKSKAAFE